MAADRNPVVQVIRRWRVQAYLDFMWMTRDFKFFLINVVSDLVLSLSGVMAVFFLAERFAGIGAWSRDQILFMLGYAALVQGLLEMFFRYNVLAVSRRIGRGQLDHTLGAAAAFVDGPAHGRLYTLLRLLGIYRRVGDQHLVFGGGWRWPWNPAGGCAMESICCLPVWWSWPFPICGARWRSGRRWVPRK